MKLYFFSYTVLIWWTLNYGKFSYKSFPKYSFLFFNYLQILSPPCFIYSWDLWMKIIILFWPKVSKWNIECLFWLSQVLDAPSLQDDFYLNVVDWSSQNVLAVGLGTCVYLWSASNSKVSFQPWLLLLLFLCINVILCGGGIELCGGYDGSGDEVMWLGT